MSESNYKFSDDCNHSDHINERILTTYILQGKIQDMSSFFIVCDKDKTGEPISLSFTLGDLADLLGRQHDPKDVGLRYDFVKRQTDILETTQWVGRFSSRDYRIVMDGILYGKSFVPQIFPGRSLYQHKNNFGDELYVEYDKVMDYRVFICDVSSRELLNHINGLEK